MQADKVIEVLLKINEKSRKQAPEVALNMAANMNLVVKRCFPHADQVIGISALIMLLDSFYNLCLCESCLFHNRRCFLKSISNF